MLGSADSEHSTLISH